jgi:hypothetical protein
MPFGVDDLDRLRFRLEFFEDRDECDDSDDDRPRRPPRARLLDRDLELAEERDDERDEPEE